MDPTPASTTVMTPDGVRLAADLVVPDDARAGVVLLHPHPRFGGNRLNAVVAALFRSLPPSGIAALRFDFRPGAGAEGSDLAEERLDTVTALDALAGHVPGAPLFLAAYSFGAAVALGVEHPALAARVVIAPPLTLVEIGDVVPLPTLVLVPAFDQFSPPAAVVPLAEALPDTTVEILDGADHFLLSRAAAVASRATEWLCDDGRRP